MLRAIFVKEGNAIWISHLDLMRVLQRSFRRAGLLLKHSQGYTPHPCLSLALPLSVGVSSQWEIMDFELAEETELSSLCERLNRVLPEGIRILSVYESERKIKELTHLRVCLTMEYENAVPEGFDAAVTALFERPALTVEKRTKSGQLTELDLLPLVSHMEWSAPDEKTRALICVICAQNPSLNPSLLVQAISREVSEPWLASIRRLEVLDGEGKVFR